MSKELILRSLRSWIDKKEGIKSETMTSTDWHNHRMMKNAKDTELDGTEEILKHEQ